MNLLALTFNEFHAYVHAQTGRGEFHARLLYASLFKKGDINFSAIPQWARYANDADSLQNQVILPQQPSAIASADGTIKFTTRLIDNSCIESVIIPENNRTTLCISSQVGCAMGCTFCATGAMGLVRNVTTEEIVGQIFSARFYLNQPIKNIVFMGMGEPLENFDNVYKSLKVLNDQRGFDISFSHITVSTSGHINGINRLATLGLTNLRLAVSLNAATEVVRTRLMPINIRYSLRDLKAALLAYPLGKREVVFFEYVLIPGINNSLPMAQAVADFCSGIPCRLNIIPFNAVSSLPYAAPTPDEVSQFYRYLVDLGLFVRIRQPHGTGVHAACGQLAGMRM